MDTITLPAAVEKFIAANNAHDIEALMAVFASDAKVADDGKPYGTTDEIRAWVGSHLVAPRVVITPTSFADGRLVASSDGDFDGGPLDFAFDFVTQGDLVSELSIDLA